MPSLFPRTEASLRADRALRSHLGMAIGLLVLGAWLAWAFTARLARYELSDSARLEVAAAAYPIQAAVSGQLARSFLVLGRDVAAGDVLIELDTRAEQLSLAEAQTRLDALGPQIAALRAQLASEQQGQSDERRVLGVSQSAAQAQFEEANAEALLAEQESGRANQLRAEGIVSVADAARARATAQSKRAAATSLRAALDKLQPELEVRERDREISHRRTLADVSKLEADVAAESAEIRRLAWEIERRRLRATVSGRLAECAVLQPGAHVAEGDRLGNIVPAGKLQVVAEFEPAAALGKVRVGQPGTLKLNGFPWAQYGVVPARVSRVAEEIRDGKVRVELAVAAAFPARISAQHGLPGSLEIEVERLSPADLVLRSAGQFVGAR